MKLLDRYKFGKQNSPSEDARRRGKFVIIVVFLFAVGYGLVSCSKSADVENSGLTPTSGSPAEAPVDSEVAKIKELTDALEGSDKLNKFSHENEYHDQLACLVCHRRDDNSAVMKFPGKAGHSPCIGCHTKQFENKENLMCTICHSDAATGEMKGFPGLRSFNAKFEHASHLYKANCADCHKPARAGISKTIPSGKATHSACFQCHTAQAEHTLSSCNVCHQQGSPGPKIKTSAKAYGVNFSHAKHNMNCNSCHKVLRGTPRGRQVTGPEASMHFAKKNRLTCATCHNNKRAFGGDDFSDCKRCHTGGNFEF
jgi:c(7)-type cytochrome triheme protein